MWRLIRMNDKKLIRIKESIKTTIHIFFQLLVTLVDICVTVFIIFGALAAIIILYKMFPNVALTLMEPMVVVFSFILRIFQIFVVILYLFLFGYLVIIIGEIFEEKRKKREKQKQKFMDDLVKKLKREIKGK